MSFELGSVLRLLQPQNRTGPLVRRPDTELTWAGDADSGGIPLLLDSSVYIDALQGWSSPTLDRLIGVRRCNHSAVCLAELTHAFGRLKPDHPETRRSLKEIRDTIADIRSHRLSAPDTDVWGAAGIVAGLLFRLGGFPAGAEQKCLNDALVYLQARKLGCAVVTRNVKDFDFLNQLVPDGQVIFYSRDMH